MPKPVIIFHCKTGNGHSATQSGNPLLYTARLYYARCVPLLSACDKATETYTFNLQRRFYTVL